MTTTDNGPGQRIPDPGMIATDSTRRALQGQAVQIDRRRADIEDVRLRVSADAADFDSMPDTLWRTLGVGSLVLAMWGCGGPSTTPTTSIAVAPSTPNPGLACGVERWFVKTLADQDAGGIVLSQVTPIAIHDLNALPSHCEGGPDRRTFPEEFRVYEIVGRVIYVAHEDDRDYHIVLEDPSDATSSVVTELADTRCAGASISPHLAALRSVEGMLASALGGNAPASLLGTTLRVQGVGFYDFDHTQRGRSKNCIELHPIVFLSR